MLSLYSWSLFSGCAVSSCFACVCCRPAGDGGVAGAPQLGSQDLQQVWPIKTSQLGTRADSVLLRSCLRVPNRSAFGDMGKGVTAVQASSPGIWGQPAQGCIPLGAYTTFVLSQ